MSQPVRQQPSVLDWLFDAIDADKLVEDAWPGAKLLGARWLETVDYLEVVAFVAGDACAFVQLNGEFVRRALRGDATSIRAITREIHALADIVAKGAE
jgi:hypothetical protein